jgi:hypothetical protein
MMLKNKAAKLGRIFEIEKLDFREGIFLGVWARKGDSAAGSPADCQGRTML